MIKNHAAIGDLLAGVIVLALLITIPLGLIGEGVLRRASRQDQAREHVEAWLEPVSTLRLVKVETKADEATILLAGNGELPSLEALEDVISEAFGMPTRITVEVVPTRVVSYSDADGKMESGVAPAVKNRHGPGAAKREPEVPPASPAGNPR